MARQCLYQVYNPVLLVIMLRKIFQMNRELTDELMESREAILGFRLGTGDVFGPGDGAARGDLFNIGDFFILGDTDLQ